MHEIKGFGSTANLDQLVKLVLRLVSSLHGRDFDVVVTMIQ